MLKFKQMPKIWKVKPKITKEFQNKFPEINPVVLQLLFNRGLTDQEKIDEFQNPDYSQDVHDPYLFTDMQKAVDRIVEAVKSNQKIVVHGDYDADGVSSTVVLVETLSKLGVKQENLNIYIPHRNTEGYGLNGETVKNFVADKVDLIITVDCGVSNAPEVKMAQQAGIDVIITDHHHVPEQLPEAYAIINPKVKSDKYPFTELAGVGVAFKLAQAIRHSQKIEGSFEKWLLDLVAIGTVADSVPLIGENRTLVKYGLIVLNKTRRLGLLELIKITRVNLGELDSHSISFQIGPRLNAAGRIEHANTAYQLLISKDQQTATDLAEQLGNTNQQRQRITKDLTANAMSQIGDLGKRLVIFVEGEGEQWQAGIVGLIAGKIADKFFRPTFVICRREGEYIGSGRSIDFLDIMEVLEQAKKYLTKYGGHAQACGLTLSGEESLSEFKKIATQTIEKKLKGMDLRPQIEIDMQLTLSMVDWSLLNELENFRPFGEGNRKPLFVAKNLKLVNFDKVGAEKKHLRLLVSHPEGQPRKAIAFGFGDRGDKLKVGQMIDLVFSVDINEWNGNREIQLKVIDIKEDD